MKQLHQKLQGLRSVIVNFFNRLFSSDTPQQPKWEYRAFGFITKDKLKLMLQDGWEYDAFYNREEGPCPVIVLRREYVKESR